MYIYIYEYIYVYIYIYMYFYILGELPGGSKGPIIGHITTVNHVCAAGPFWERLIKLEEANIDGNISYNK